MKDLKKMSNETISSSQYILDTSRDYSIYVCENRAIPKLSDGLKDAQRKALWLLRNNREKIKVISHAGALISENLYLHGDISASNAISMMAAPYVNNVPLIEGIGAFGTRVSPVDGIGAGRYVYVKKNRITEELVYPDLDIVPLKDNYDGSTKEPIHFLPLIPLVLLNGISGIAVGWSTEILPRKFQDLVKATKNVLNGKKIDRLIPHYELYNVDVSNIEGNVWQLNGRVEIVDTSTIRITELPPDMSLEKFKDRLNAMEDKDQINGYTDKSTKTIDIVVKFQRGSIKDWTNEQAIDFFKLKQRKTERIVVVNWDNSSIKQYENAENVVIDFVNWRIKWYTTRYEKKRDDDQYELNYWNAVKLCFDKKLPEKIQKMNNKQDIMEEIKNITISIDLDNKQYDKIASLPTYRWAKDAYFDVKDNIQKLEENIKEYNDILSKPERIKKIYNDELDGLMKISK